jgi:hypothetical protein
MSKRKNLEKLIDDLTETQIHDLLFFLYEDQLVLSITTINMWRSLNRLPLKESPVKDYDG